MPQTRRVASRSCNYAAGDDYDEIIKNCVVDCLDELEAEFERDFDVESINITPVTITSARTGTVTDIVLVVSVVGVEQRGRFLGIF